MLCLTGVSPNHVTVCLISTVTVSSRVRNEPGDQELCLQGGSGSVSALVFEESPWGPPHPHPAIMRWSFCIAPLNPSDEQTDHFWGNDFPPCVGQGCWDSVISQ